VIAEIHLHLWARQPALDQKPPQPSLHRRFGRRRQAGEGTQPSATRIAIKGCCIRQTPAQRHVDRDQGFLCGPSKAQVAERPVH
jgi:hypothetical protein